MKKLLIFIIFIMLSSIAAAECIEPTDGMQITQDTVFCGRTFDLPSGISINADNIELDCDGAILRGNMQSETGIFVENRKNVMIRECNIVTYKLGIYLKNTTKSIVRKSSMLKNQIGIRLLNSYENSITEMTDKSTEIPLSVINSKFNTFMYENKNIEEGFCSSNICNEPSDLSFCEDNDFYCSESCNPDNDQDCKGTIALPQVQEEPKEQQPEQKTEQTINKTPTGMAAAQEPAQESKQKSHWILYIITYIIAFLALQFYTYTQNSIRIKL